MAGCPEPAWKNWKPTPLSAARYAGHKAPGMTFGLYSKGGESQLLKVAQTIGYPQELEQALVRTLQL